MFVLIVTLLCEPGVGIILAIFLYIIMAFLQMPNVGDEPNTVQNSFNKILNLLALFFCSVIAMAMLIWAMRVSNHKSILKCKSTVTDIKDSLTSVTETIDGIIVFSPHDHRVL